MYCATSQGQIPVTQWPSTPEMILASHSGTSAGDSYTFLDTDVDFGQMYRYKLEIVKLDGTREEFGLAESGLVGVYFYSYLPLLQK